MDRVKEEKRLAKMLAMVEAIVRARYAERYAEEMGLRLEAYRLFGPSVAAFDSTLN